MTLTGYIDTYAAKLAAERAVKRVRGVKGVANDLEVWLKIGRTDADIARDAVRALELRGTVPETIQVAVHDGHITLTGKAGWVYQARHAEAVRHIKGVRGVFNHIEVADGEAAGCPAPDRRGTPPECRSRCPARGHRRLPETLPCLPDRSQRGSSARRLNAAARRAWSYSREERDSRRTSRTG